MVHPLHPSKELTPPVDRFVGSITGSEVDRDAVPRRLPVNN